MFKQFIILYNLIVNEMKKILNIKKYFVILIIFLIAISFYAAIQPESNLYNWRNNANETKQIMEETLKSMDKQDNSFLFNTTTEVIKNIDYCLKTGTPYMVITPLEYVNKASILGYLICILTILLSVEILFVDFKNGAIKQILIKPISRIKFFSSKITTLYIINVILIASFYILAILVGFILFSKNGFNINEIMVLNGIGEKINLIDKCLSNFLTLLLLSCFLSSMSLLISFISKSAIFSTGIILTTVLVSKIIESYIDQYGWYHYSFFKLININSITLYTVLLWIIYILSMNVISTIIFSKKNF